MKKDRTRWEILRDILRLTGEENKAKKTRLMQRADLDWTKFQRYFDFLLEEGFIKGSNPLPEYYELTEKGRTFLARLKDL